MTSSLRSGYALAAAALAAAVALSSAFTTTGKIEGTLCILNVQIKHSYWNEIEKKNEKLL